MTPTQDNVTHHAPYKGKMHVIFGNCQFLNVSPIGTLSVCKQLLLKDILVVPHLTKKLRTDWMQIQPKTLKFPFFHGLVNRKYDNQLFTGDAWQISEKEKKESTICGYRSSFHSQSK